MVRSKTGVGRAAKQDYVIEKSVGKEFFETMDEWRQWSFGFTEYYDVYVWDFEPGLSFHNINSVVTRVSQTASLKRKRAHTLQSLFKAHRFCQAKDVYALTAPILRTITIDKDTELSRDAQPENETACDVLYHDETTMSFMDPYGKHGSNEMPSYLAYTEDDALEDAVLFPEGIPADSDYPPGPENQSTALALARKSQTGVDLSLASRFVGAVGRMEEDPALLIEQFVKDPYFMDINEDGPEDEESEDGSDEGPLAEDEADYPKHKHNPRKQALTTRSGGPELDIDLQDEVVKHVLFRVFENQM